MKSSLSVLLSVLLFSYCSSDTKESTQAPVTQSTEKGNQENTLTVSSTCPDSAISYDHYKRYWSTDLPIDPDILTEFKISDDERVDILKIAMEEQNQVSVYKAYELFTKGIDGEKFLAKKGIAKHLKGESPYDLEYYLVHGDTLIGGSDSPTYYYYDQHDSLRLIESYFHDNVEGCTFSKAIKYFSGGKLLLFREYQFNLNCWPSEGDSLNGFKLDGKFAETFQFMNQHSQDFYNREFSFFECTERYIVKKTYNARHEQEAAPAENTNLVKYN